MPIAQEHQIATGGKEYIDKTVEILTRAFEGDPVFTWLLQDFPQSQHQSILPRYLRAFFTAASLNRGMFINADGFGCCAVLLPPGARIDNPWTLLPAGLIPAIFATGLRGLKRAIFEYPGATDALLEKGLTKAEQKEHWYVFIMATAEDRRQQGLAGTLLDDGRPLWLEATTAYSRDLYLKHGFTAVGGARLGKGTVGADGLPAKGGDGVMIWGMV
ncbi:hypothetical protein DFH08DRAFT_762499 [Mycena albidolilacea]|uniref:N-acetyltransferase domain-containing protein n=1 Tax=Mycena albidolilacea TaxID=1033008 RepID=A0AAD7AV15_9AGAR|nr:hypothetical protein DFH08DRAFT_762499 [Mycena albidolilacea]